MTDTFSERRLVENEVFFRELNEKVETTFEELEEIAKEEGEESWIRESDLPIHFYCECSDENCRERIIIKPSLYKKIHQDRSTFIVKIGHEVENIEEIVKKSSRYILVRKYLEPPSSSKKLNSTNVNNV